MNGNHSSRIEGGVNKDSRPRRARQRHSACLVLESLLEGIPVKVRGDWWGMGEDFSVGPLRVRRQLESGPLSLIAFEPWLPGTPLKDAVVVGADLLLLKEFLALCDSMDDADRAILSAQLVLTREHRGGSAT